MELKLPTRKALAEHFNDLGFKIGAEIGVSSGKYSEVLCRKIPGLKLYCVDLWRKTPENGRSPNDERQERHYQEAIQRLSSYRVHFMRMSSMEAVKLIPDESLDFVFIDANHDYKFVLEDITEWSKKVRKGGIVSGHDYYDFIRSGIIPAVTKYLSDKPEIQLNITEAHRKPDEPHSFWWVKP